MAHTTTVTVNGQNYPVTEFDHSLQEIDDAVDNMGSASTPQAALAALGAGVRPNELDNPGLDVNQQGQASYNTLNASGYGVDRWWSFFANYEVATKTITSVSQQFGSAFRQPIGNPSRFAGKTVTFTVWVLSGAGTMGLTKSTGLNSGLSPLTSLAINGPGVYSVAANIPEDVGGETYPYLLVTVSTPVGGSIQFASPIPFKLEFGEGQTLAYQDSDGNWQPLPQSDNKEGAQLLECQRYYQLYRTQSLRPNYAADCRPVMRIDPTQGTIQINGVTYYYNDANL